MAGRVTLATKYCSSTFCLWSKGIELKRVVLALELNEDEAAQVVDAVNRTDVRFAGMTLGDIFAEQDRAIPESRGGGTQIREVRSEGAIALGMKPMSFALAAH